MKRRKTQQSIRAAAARKKAAKKWGVFDFGSGSFTTGATFIASGNLTFSNFKDGDYILITDDSSTGGWTHFSFDLGKKPTNPKRVHPARRRKMLREQKIESNGIYTITDGGSSTNCRKIDDTRMIRSDIYN